MVVEDQPRQAGEAGNTSSMGLPNLDQGLSEDGALPKFGLWLKPRNRRSCGHGHG